MAKKVVPIDRIASLVEQNISGLFNQEGSRDICTLVIAFLSVNAGHSEQCVGRALRNDNLVDETARKTVKGLYSGVPRFKQAVDKVARIIGLPEDHLDLD